MGIFDIFDRTGYIKCLACGEYIKKDEFAVICEKYGVCISCQEKLPFVPVGTIYDGKGDIDFSASVFFYAQPIIKMIYEFKFRGATAYGKILASYMSDITELVVDKEYGFNMIVPVPLSDKRMKERGFNQAEMLSQKVAETTGLVHTVRALTKIKDTKSQAQLSPFERGTNLSGAFLADSSLVRGRRIIITDDVYTTGNTLRECAKALKAAGAERVMGLTVARKGGEDGRSREFYELLGHGKR